MPKVLLKCKSFSDIKLIFITIMSIMVNIIFHLNSYFELNAQCFCEKLLRK